MTSPRTLAADAMATPSEVVDETHVWRLLGDLDGWRIFAAKVGGDGDGSPADTAARGVADLSSTVGAPDPERDPAPRPGPVVPQESDARAGAIGDADGMHAGPGSESTSADGDGTPVPPAVPVAGSIEDQRAFVEWIADANLEALAGSNNGLFAVVFEIRQRARALLEHPGPVGDDTRRRRAIEDIYRKLLPKGKHASFLAGQVRRHRAERLSDLPTDALEEILRTTARTAQQRGWPR